MQLQMPPIIPDHCLQRDGLRYRVQPYTSQFGFIDAVGYVGEVEGGGFEEGDEVGPGGVLVVLEANPSVVVAEVGVIGKVEGCGLVLEVDDAVGVVGGGVAEVAEDHFDGAVLGIEAGGLTSAGSARSLGSQMATRRRISAV